MRQWLVFILLCGLLVSVSPGAAQDIDSPITIQYGETVTYDLPGNSKIFFTFDGQAGDVVLATASGAAFDYGLYGQLSGADGRFAPSVSSDSGNDKLALIGMLTADRDYKFSVGSPSEHSGPVEVTLERVGCRTATAGRSLIRGEMIGDVLREGLMSRWWFEAQAGELVEVQLMAAPTLPGLYLHLYGPDGSLLDVDDEFSSGYLHRVSAVAPAAGTYRVEVTSDPDLGSGVIPEDVPYLMRLDTPQAAALAYDQAHAGQLASGLDAAHITFEGTAGDVIFVDLAADNPDALHLNYRILGSAAPIYVAGERSHRWILLDSGTFGIEVFLDYGASDAGGTFSLALSRPAVSTITPIAHGETQTIYLNGTVAPLLSFEGAAGDMIEFVVNSDTFISRSALGGPGLYIEDVDTGTLASSLISGVTLPVDGTYYLLPHNYHGKDYGSENYPIPVTLQRLDPAPAIAYGDTIEAMLNAREVNRHVFEGHAGDDVTIVLRTDTLQSTRLLLSGPSGPLVSNMELSSDALEVIPATRLPADGLYTILVNTYDGLISGAYTLSLAEGLSPDVVTLEAGQELSAGDAGVFQFEASPGDLFQVAATGITGRVDIVSPIGEQLSPFAQDTLMQATTGGVYTFALDSGANARARVTITPYAPGYSDSDEDGFSDNLDRCPAESGTSDGCPATDSDGDGILDWQDACPETAGSLNGCPDTDGDGIGDGSDLCPDDPGSSAAQGCPDADGDGIADAMDACPGAAGNAALDGCPDTDGDGVSDPNDECPDVPGLAESGGCGFYGRVSGNANLRAGTGTTFDIVGSVTPSDDILILGRNAAGDWLRVRVGSTEAWLFASLVTTDVDIASLPVVE